MSGIGRMGRYEVESTVPAITTIFTVVDAYACQEFHVQKFMEEGTAALVEHAVKVEAWEIASELLG